MSRADLFSVVKVKRFKDFFEIMSTCGVKKDALGCEICKPAIGSILSSLLVIFLYLIHMKLKSMAGTTSMSWILCITKIKTRTTDFLQIFSATERSALFHGLPQVKSLLMASLLSDKLLRSMGYTRR
jgi:hypothetical protein